MRKITIDIETDSLNPERLWCVGFQVHGKEPQIVTRSEDLPDFNQFDEIVGHNIIKFDSYWLDKLWHVSLPKDKIVDTQVLSRLFNPSIDGGHSLKAWGKRIGDYKDDFDPENFALGYTEEMGDYCKQDVNVTTQVYDKLSKLLSDSRFSQDSIDLEHDVAWIVAKQERNGFLFDADKAAHIFKLVSDRMEEIETEMQETFPPIVTERWSEKTGKRLKDHVEVFNPGSRQQVAKRLEEKGVVFTVFTDTGRPKIDETILDSIDAPEAKLVAEYLTLDKRKGQISGWFDHVMEDGRVHGEVITNGAITGRMTHSRPNMAQVPAAYKPYYGKECRECWTVPPLHKLVGADASGLELRMLAHYMKDDDYTKEVVEGDVHARNQEAAGLPTRDNAKTFIYAFLYGAGDAKIGKIIGGSSKQGRALKEKFLEGVPALKDLKDLIDKLSESGSLPGLDGRRLRVRSAHAALNTLLQGAGAIVMKKALVILASRLDELKIPHKFVANVHDEFQIETPEHFAKAVGKQAVKAIRDAGVELGLRVPLDGDYKVGDNWSQTH